MVQLMEINWNGVAEFLSTSYILADATMIKTKNLPHQPVPEISVSRNGTTDDVYDALCAVIEDVFNKHSDVIMPVSGGWDSRIIAGIVSDLGYSIPTYAAYHFGESLMAKKVCKKLGMTHYHLDTDISLNEETYDRVKQIAIDYLGTKSVGSIFAENVVTNCLSDIGICDRKTTIILHGGMANGLLAYAVYYDTPESYYEHFVQKDAPSWCKKISRDNHYKVLSGLDKNSMSVKFAALSWRRKLNYTRTLNLEPIYLDSGVLSAIYSLPDSIRGNRDFQSHFLKKKFPELSKIPSTNVYFPFVSRDYRALVNVIGRNTTRKINAILRRCRKSLFLGGMDLDYFVYVNRDFLMKKLRRFTECDKRIPIRQGISMLEQGTIKHGGYILRILTSAILMVYGDG